jgi:hypothetical protein
MNKASLIADMVVLSLAGAAGELTHTHTWRGFLRSRIPLCDPALASILAKYGCNIPHCDPALPFRCFACRVSFLVRV